MLGYTIAAAQACTKLTDFLVSTDSLQIADIARAGGAPVPFLRPGALATDEAAMPGVLQHALEWYERRHQRRVHSVVTLQPTTPLRLAGDIDAAIEHYITCQPGADSLISVCESGQMHPVTLYRQDGMFAQPLLSGRMQTTRRQEFDRVFWRNGAVYITRRDLLLEQNEVIGQRPLVYEMPRHRSVNIDDLFDFELAEWMLSHEALERLDPT